MKCHLFCIQAKSTVNERIRWSMYEGRALVLINNLNIPRQVRVRATCTKQLFEALKKKSSSKNTFQEAIKRLVCSDLLVALELKVAVKCNWNLCMYRNS